MSEYPNFRRPYFRKIYSGLKSGHQEPHYLYHLNLFRQYDIFPLFVLDGGAFLFTMEHIGGASGSDFVNALLSGKLLAPWIQDDHISWDKAILGTTRGKSFPREKHCWVNRLYFLLPLAQQFFRTGDEKWAKLWLHYFEAWMTQHHDRIEDSYLHRYLDVVRMQVIGFLKMCSSIKIFAHIKRRLGITRGPGYLAWEDMQLTWRFLVLVHSVILLNKSRLLRKEHWKRIYQLIFHHAELICREVVAELKTFGSGNHFLQKGVALLYTGLLFPENRSAREYVAYGRDVVSRHMLTEITADGMSVESSPSYSHFIARLHLEACLLLEANAEPPIPGLRKSVAKQYRFLSQTASPSNLSLPFSDSYHLDVTLDKAIVQTLMPSLNFGPPESVLFEGSSFAVLRQKDFTVFVDATREDLYHHHSGKPHIILYYCRFPVLIDSGCCNYDRETHHEWYITPQAHNGVLVEPIDTRRWKVKRTHIPQVRLLDFQDTPDKKSITMVRESNTSSLNYLWQRRIIVGSSCVEMVDQISSPKKVKCILLFHLAPSSVINERETGIFNVSNPNWFLLLQQKSENSNLRPIRQTIALSESNKECHSPELQIVGEGNAVRFHTIFTFQ